MPRKRFVVWTVGLAILLGGLAGTGCRKKFSCKNFAARVKKCSKELKQAAVAGAAAKAKKEAAKLSAEEQEKKVEAARRTAEGMVGLIVAMMSSDEFVKKCEKEKGSDKGKKDVEKLKACYEKSSCKAFAECIVKN